MTQISTPSNHLLLVCTTEHPDGGWSCMFCAGGLSACTRCGAFEGAWPDQCPGKPMSADQSDAVYAGVLNYRDDAWRPGECCQMMSWKSS